MRAPSRTAPGLSCGGDEARDLNTEGKAMTDKDMQDKVVQSLQEQVDTAQRLRRMAREEANRAREELEHMQDRLRSWRARNPNANSAVCAALGAAIMLLIIMELTR